MDKATPDYLRGRRPGGGNIHTEEMAKATPDYLRGKTRSRQYREEVA